MAKIVLTPLGGTINLQERLRAALAAAGHTVKVAQEVSDIETALTDMHPDLFIAFDKEAANALQELIAHRGGRVISIIPPKNLFFHPADEHEKLIQFTVSHTVEAVAHLTKPKPLHGKKFLVGGPISYMKLLDEVCLQLQDQGATAIQVHTPEDVLAQASMEQFNSIVVIATGNFDWTTQLQTLGIRLPAIVFAWTLNPPKDESAQHVLVGGTTDSADSDTTRILAKLGF